MTKQHAKTVIIGAGPAGYTAAIYAARAMLEPVLIAGDVPGGQLSTTTDVENYPGFPKAVQGPWLMEQMKQQAESVGTAFVKGRVVSIDLNSSPFQAFLELGNVWTADTLILATGARSRWLGLASETKYKGYGVSSCATCDGFFFRKSEVVVVGGGNTAIEEALFMSRIASKVTVVHRRDKFKADQVLQIRLAATPNIELELNSVVDEIVGVSKPAVSGVRIKNRLTGATREIVAEGVFIAIGHDPATDLIRTQLRMKDNGYIWTEPDSTATSVPGVFAAGDVRDEVFRQAVTAAGSGCMAALEAEKFLSVQGILA